MIRCVVAGVYLSMRPAERTPGVVVCLYGFGAGVNSGVDNVMSGAGDGAVGGKDNLTIVLVVLAVGKTDGCVPL